MQTILRQLKEELFKIFTKYYQGESSTYTEVELAFPDNSDHGDISLNIAMKMSKVVKKAPFVIANELINLLKANSYFVKYFSDFKVAGPGFLNLFYADTMFNLIISRINAEQDRYGCNSSCEGESQLLEFVSANPTGPLTIAHARQAVVGDSLARIMKFCSGKPFKEYYLNDKGVQINVLGESVFRRYLECSGVEIASDFPDYCYKGSYIADIASIMVDKYGKSLQNCSISEGTDKLKNDSYLFILDGIKKDLRDFRVEFDSYFSEKTLEKNGKIEECLTILKEHGYTYEKDNALWFKTTTFGDDKDRVLIKSDGEYTYLTSDIPYHQDKLKRGYNKLIDILGPDHHGYIKRLKASIEALGFDQKQLDVLIVQLSTLYRGDMQLKMSTRQGEFISLRELVAEVGVDASRYFFASKKTDSHLDFDLELAKKQTPDNPVFYVQYAIVRINSILNKANEKDCFFKNNELKFDVSTLGDGEKKLIKVMGCFPEILSDVAKNLEPQRLTTYLEEIAAVFQSYYSSGNKIITDDLHLTMHKLLVCKAFKHVVVNGLDLLGINVPDRM